MNGVWARFGTSVVVGGLDCCFFSRESVMNSHCSGGGMTMEAKFAFASASGGGDDD